MAELTLRPSQAQILRYRGGRLGISAVPGSGKTFTLSALAAQIIAEGRIGPDQEVLVVTLVNSAVENFAYRIGGLIRERGLLPHLGYRVRTLHGLAHDIVREKPALAGLEERFQIVDEREADFIRKEAAEAWLAAHPSVKLLTRIESIELEGTEQARVQVTVGMLGREANGASDWDLAVDVERLDIRLAREGGRWRVVGARWQE